jgi:hypothetical protein
MSHHHSALLQATGGGGGGGLVLRNSGLILNHTTPDASSFTSSSITVAADEIAVIKAVLRRTSASTDVDNVVAGFTLAGAALTIPSGGNYRQAGAFKPAAVIGYLAGARTGSVVLDMTGSPVAFEACQIFYETWAGAHGTPVIGAAATVLKSTSAAGDITLSRTTSHDGGLLTGAIMGGDGTITMTPSAGTTVVAPTATGSSTGEDFVGWSAYSLTATAGAAAITASLSGGVAIGIGLELRPS